MAKQRLSVYLDHTTMTALTTYADRRGKSLSLIAEAAIASFLSPDTVEQLEGALTRRLDRSDRRVDRLERDLAISVEMMAQFIRFWLTSTPPPSENERAQLRQLGGERYDAFMEALGRRLARGMSVRSEIGEDVRVCGNVS